VPPKLLTLAEVADLLGVSSAWVRDHASGRRVPKLPAVKLGTADGKGLWRFIPQELEDFICKQRTDSGAARR
jgi:predicted DNA-binding transcriptional regulator AlpA